MLDQSQRAKLDETSDDFFYDAPRFVTHVDDGFIGQLRELYQQRLQPEALPLAWVEGHGMNEAELARNPRLSHYFLQNLNENQTLPLADQSFDAVLNTVSVQYLQQPEKVFAELYRVLKPGGIVIVSFSNRMFYQKAIAAWRDNSESGRVELVKRYFRSVAGFGTPEVIAKVSTVPPILQMMGLGGGDPFYAVIAERMELLVK
jgi:SAM-dependent methyltransferase